LSSREIIIIIMGMRYIWNCGVAEDLMGPYYNLLFLFAFFPSDMDKEWWWWWY